MSRVKLGDVAREVRENTKETSGLPIVGLEHMDSGNLYLSRWSEASENTFTKRFHKGQILFGRRRAYQKKTAVAPFDGICSGDITVIAAKEDRIHPRLLPFIIGDDRFFDYAMEKSAGSLSPRVKWEQLSEYEFELPQIEKQAYFVDLLWSMERVKSAYKEFLMQTDEIVKSRFVEWFGDLKTNPKGLPIVEIGDLFEVGSSKRVMQKDWKTEGIPFYRAREIVVLSEKGYVNNELFITPEMFDEYAKKYGIPVAGDIMVTGVGTLGVCYLVKEGDKFYYKDGNTLCFHNKGEVNSRFILECYKMPFVREQIEANAGGTTVGTYTIMNARKTKVIYPSVEEQGRFVALVEQSDKSKFAVQKTLESLLKTQKNIMKNAFE